MKSRLLVVAAVLAISQPTSAMKREHGGPTSNFDPIRATIVITGIVATTIYNTCNPQTRQTGEILLAVDDEQLAALQKANELTRQRNFMTALFKKLVLHYESIPITSSSNPALLLTMGAIVDRSGHTAVTAAANAVWEAFKNGRAEGYAPWVGVFAGSTALTTARAAAFNAVKDAAFGPARGTAWNAAERAGRYARYRVCREAALNAALEALALGATPEKIEEAAYRASERAILNWLLENIEMAIEAVYPPVLKALGNNPANNPFNSNQALVPFVNQHFGALDDEAMLYLAPWLVLVLPISVIPEIHRPLFIHLCVMLIWPQVAPLMLVEGDTGSTLQIFSRDIFGFIRSRVITILLYT